MRKFLLAEDCNGQRALLRTILQRQYINAEIREAKDGAEAIQLLNEFQPDIVLTDYSMPMQNGYEVADKSKEIYPECKVVLISLIADRLAGTANIDYIIKKPYTSTELFKTMILALG